MERLTRARRLRRLRCAGQVALVALAMGVTVAGYDALYASSASRLPLAGAAVAGVLSALPFLVRIRRVERRKALRRKRIHLPARAVLLAVLAIAAWAATAPAEGRDPADLAAGTVHLFTFNQPVDASAELLALPFAVTALATHAAVALLGARPPLAPLVPVALAWSVQLLLCAGAGHDAVPAVVLGLAAAALALLRRAPEDPVPAPDRRAAGLMAAVALVAAVAAGGTALATAAADLDRLDPRDRWTAADPAQLEATPLGLLKAELALPAAERFTVRFSGAPSAPVLIPVATLDRFDGVTWSAAPGFRVSGTVLRPAVPAGPRVAAEIRVRDLPGRLLPAPTAPVAMPARPAAAGADGISFDPAVGLVARTDPRGWAYTVEGAAGDPADPPAATELGDDVPGAAALRGLPVRWVPGRLPGAAELAELALRMHRLPYSPGAPAGHSVRAVIRILEGTKPANGGFAEQHASAFALLARVAGRESRVVVGYRLTRRDASGGYVVRAGDAHAWSEVWLGGRWVTFDPTDVTRPVTPYPGARTVASAAQPIVPVVDERPVVPPDPVADLPWYREQGVRVAAAVSLLVLVLIAALVATVLRVVRVLRRRRRAEPDPDAVADAGPPPAELRQRRRAEGPPDRRVLGAWAETLDALRRNGIPVPENAGPARALAVARAAAPAAWLGPLTALAGLVNEALFAPQPPAESAATTAWLLEEQLRGLVAGTGRGDVRS